MPLPMRRCELALLGPSCRRGMRVSPKELGEAHWAYPIPDIVPGVYAIPV